MAVPKVRVRTRVEPVERIVVVGASAGGYEATRKLVSGLHRGLNAAVFVVLHVPPDFDGSYFVQVLQNDSALPCELAEDGPFRAGVVYVAPPDHHTLVKRGRILLAKGPPENRHRPALDPLFRSAAVAYGSRAIGVVLTGTLDDGTAGLDAIHRAGGITVVQAPADAAFPAMPQSAIDHVPIDHRSRLADMGALLERLVRARPPRRKAIPGEVVKEAAIAERVLSDVRGVQALGEQVPYNCPECGGVLWQMSQPETKRYRCHTGHVFTAATLLEAQAEKIEETLWVALRMLEERRNMFDAMSRKRRSLPPFSRERARDTEVHIARVREMLHGRGARGEDDSRRTALSRAAKGAGTRARPPKR